MAHTHDVYDTGKHFEINGISRFINETSATKLVLVQGDHNSEVITFQMPRYIDGHDMLLCNKIRVHYINLDTKTNDKSADIYEVTDLALCEECEEETLTFTWKIEAPATKYYGSLAFLIKFECTEGDSILYQWNTAKYVSVNVLAGIDNGEEFVDKYSNVLEEWYNELTRGADSIEELSQQALAEIELAKEDAKEDIESKANSTMVAMNQFSSNAYNSFKNDVDVKAARTLASIPEDYSDLDADVKKLKNEGVDILDFENATVENYFDAETSEVVLAQGGYYESGVKFDISSYSYVKIRLLSNKTYCCNYYNTTYSIIIQSLDGEYLSTVPINDEKIISVPYYQDKEVYLVITWIGRTFNADNFSVVEGENKPSGTEKHMVYVPWLKAGCVPDETIPEFVIEKQSIKKDLLEQKIPPYILDGIGCNNYFDADYNIANAEINQLATPYYYTGWNYLPEGTYTINNCYLYITKTIDGVETTHNLENVNKSATFTMTKDEPYFKAMVHCHGKGSEYLRNTIIQKGEKCVKVDEVKYLLEKFVFAGQIGYYPTHWDNKNYVAIGDSITRGYAPADTEEGIADGSQITPCYADYIAEKLNMNTKNYGADGATVRTTLQNNKVVTLQNAGFTPDVVTIYLGANDMASIPLGTIDDEYTSYSDCTFYGGMKQIIKEFQDAFPMCTIILLGNTPTKVHTESKIKQYNQAKKEIAEKYNVLYCDLYNECGFNLNNETIVKKFRLDSIHPNHNAHLIMGSRLTGFIASH